MGGPAIRRVAASALVTLGVLMALAGTIFSYVDSHYHDGEVFVANNEALADNAAIRERVFNGFIDEITTLADGDGVVNQPAATGDEPGVGSLFGDDNLDPETDERIARNESIEATVIAVMDTPLYREVFLSSLPGVNQQLVRSAELEPSALLGDSGEIRFDMRRLYPPIWQRLASDPSTSFITEKEVPPSYGIFDVASRETTTDQLWAIVRNGPGWRGLALFLAVVSFAGAVVIADRRPSTVLQFGGGLVLGALFIGVLVYVVRAVMPLLASSNAAAVSAVYAANTAPLVSGLTRLAIIGAILTAIGLVVRFFWPDDWVLDQVNDPTGVRSVKRLRGSKAAEQPAAQAPQPAYYPQAAPGAYPPGWGQPYPGQPYAQPYQVPPPGYGYPAAPYAQPQAAQQPAAPGYNPGRPTVPVMPVDVSGDSDSRPADAAGAVPRVDTSAPATPPEAPDDDGWSAQDW